MPWPWTSRSGPTEAVPAPGPVEVVLEDGTLRTACPEGEHEHLRLQVADVADLGAAVLLLAGRARARRVTLHLARWRTPYRTWLPAVPRLAGAAGGAVRFDGQGAGCEFDLTFPAAVDVGGLLHRLLRELQRVRASGPGSPEVGLGWPPPGEARPLLSRITELALPADPAGTKEVAARQAELQLGVDLLAEVLGTWSVIDPAAHHPMGRDHRAHGSAARAEQEAPDILSLTVFGDPPADPVRVRLDRGVSAGDAERLRGVDRVDASGVPADPAVLRALVQLSAGGAAVYAPQLSHAAELVAELGAAWATPVPADDLLAVTAASVRQRRAAHWHYGPDAVLRRASGSAVPAVSALLVTKRPERLRHALSQLAGMRYPSLQLVLGLHGDGFDRALVDRCVRDLVPQRDVVVVEVPYERPFGEALSIVSARADGTLLTKVDDDDFYGPEHIRDLVVAREYSGAEVVGKPPEYVYLDALDVTVRRPQYPVERFGKFVGGGTIMLSRADLESVGGWRPVPSAVDRALLDRVLGAGGLVYATHPLGYVYVRHSGQHTWDPGTAHFLARTARQWPGVVRHAEFGTADQDATPVTVP